MACMLSSLRREHRDAKNWPVAFASQFRRLLVKCLLYGNLVREQVFIMFLQEAGQLRTEAMRSKCKEISQDHDVPIRLGVELLVKGA